MRIVLAIFLLLAACREPSKPAALPGQPAGDEVESMVYNYYNLKKDSAGLKPVADSVRILDCRTVPDSMGGRFRLPPGKKELAMAQVWVSGHNEGAAGQQPFGENLVILMARYPDGNWWGVEFIHSK